MWSDLVVILVLNYRMYGHLHLIKLYISIVISILKNINLLGQEKVIDIGDVW